VELRCLLFYSLVASEGAYAFGAIKSREILNSGLNPFVLNGWQMVIGGLALIGLSFPTENWDLALTGDIILSWLYLVIFGSLIGHGAFYWLVRRAGPLLPSTWSYVSPVIAQFVGYCWLDEYLSVFSFIGLVLVLFGVFVVGQAALIEEWFKKQWSTNASA